MSPAAASAVVALAAFLLFLGGRARRTMTDAGPLTAFVGACLPAAALLVLVGIADALWAAPSFAWNSPRLAITFALAKGFGLYAGATSGTVNGNVYGPVQALVYLPATLFSRPVPALLCGASIAAACFFAPMAWLHLRSGVSQAGSRTWAWTGLLLFGFCTLLSDPLRYSAFSVHADAPALGFGAAACAALLPGRRQEWPRLALAAVLATLAVWSKQTFAPLLVALPLYLLAAEGRRCCLRFTLCLVVALSGISLLILSAFDPQDLLLNMITVPSRHPWKETLGPGSALVAASTRGPHSMAVLAEALAGLLRSSAAALGFVAGCLIAMRWTSEPGPRGLRARLQRHPWTLLAFVGLAMVPTSLLGRVKMGGDVNSLSGSVYFFVGAATLLFRQTMVGLPDRRASRGVRGSATAARITTGALSGVALAAAILAVLGVRHLREIPAAPLQAAVDAARSHPEQIYFPSNALVGLMAEGRYDHDAYALYDRELAGMPVSPEHFRAHVPARLDTVVYSATYGRLSIPNYLPGFTAATPSREFPGWFVSRRP